ncbi:acetyl-CoA carboxylase carboxyl transferase subunit beta [bacterium]|jgi:acetyl-CoA carboxylase carboxyl transferase subunit beta|nr:acetyl-CoA carboxylase carboxyl transferase subunit beta [bacterium]
MKENKLNTEDWLPWFKKIFKEEGKVCKKCEYAFTHSEYKELKAVCPKCFFYNRLNALERVEMFSGENEFEELFSEIESKDILDFEDTQKYSKRLKKYKKKTKMKSGCMVVKTKIKDVSAVLIAFDFDFGGGSLGIAEGQKITEASYYCIENNLPLVIVNCSGGARMQESIFSLMQMAKTSAAIGELSKKQIPFISVLTNPTMGGVSASFATLGDVLIGEPNAMIGFAGKRVIQQTIGSSVELPSTFQMSEKLLELGLIDMVIERENMVEEVSNILKILKKD